MSLGRIREIKSKRRQKNKEMCAGLCTEHKPKSFSQVVSGTKLRPAYMLYNHYHKWDEYPQLCYPFSRWVNKVSPCSRQVAKPVSCSVLPDPETAWFLSKVPHWIHTWEPLKLRDSVPLLKSSGEQGGLRGYLRVVGKWTCKELSS